MRGPKTNAHNGHFFKITNNKNSVACIIDTNRNRKHRIGRNTNSNNKRNLNSNIDRSINSIIRLKPLNTFKTIKTVKTV